MPGQFNSDIENELARKLRSLSNPYPSLERDYDSLDMIGYPFNANEVSPIIKGADTPIGAPRIQPMDLQPSPIPPMPTPEVQSEIPPGRFPMSQVSGNSLVPNFDDFRAPKELEKRLSLPPADEFDDADSMDSNRSMLTGIARAWANAGEGMTGVTSDKGLWDNLMKRAERSGPAAAAKTKAQIEKLTLQRDLQKDDPNAPDALAVKKMLEDVGYTVPKQMTTRQMEGAFGTYWKNIYDAAQSKYKAEIDAESRATEKGLDRQFQSDLQAGKSAVEVETAAQKLASEEAKAEAERKARSQDKADTDKRDFEEKKFLQEQNARLMKEIKAMEIGNQTRKESKLSDSQLEAISDIDNAIATAKEVAAGANDEYVGPFDSLLPDVAVSGEESNFRKKHGRMQDAYRRVVTGAAAPFMELKTIQGRLPQLGQRQTNFRAGAQGYIEELERQRRGVLENFKKQGKTVDQFEGSNPLDAKRKRLEELRKKDAGKQ
jgi:hypothetical protein